jgi:hypothetical protein
MELISGTTLVGVLPVPHSIVVRRYIPNAYTNMWFTTYVWGVIFLRNQSYALMDGQRIRMFTVSQPVHDEFDEFGEPVHHHQLHDQLHHDATGTPGTGVGAQQTGHEAQQHQTVATVSNDEDDHARGQAIAVAHAALPSGGGPIV